jgi:hypothetical protein
MGNAAGGGRRGEGVRKMVRAAPGAAPGVALGMECVGVEPQPAAPGAYSPGGGEAGQDGAGEGSARGGKGSRRQGKLRLLTRGLGRLGLAHDSARAARRLGQRRGSSEESAGEVSLSIGQPYRLAASHEQLRVLLLARKPIKHYAASTEPRVERCARWEEFKTKQCPVGPAPCPPEQPPPLPRKLSRSRSSAGRGSRCAHLARADSLPAMQLSSY